MGFTELHLKLNLNSPEVLRWLFSNGDAFWWRPSEAVLKVVESSHGHLLTLRRSLPALPTGMSGVKCHEVHSV